MGYYAMPPSSQFPIFSYASAATQRVSYFMLYLRLTYIVILHPSTLGSLAYWRCTRCILWVLPKRGCIPAFPRFMSLRVCMLRKKHLFFFNDAAEICHHYRRFSRHFWNNLVCCGRDLQQLTTQNKIPDLAAGFFWYKKNNCWAGGLAQRRIKETKQSSRTSDLARIKDEKQIQQTSWLK